MKLALLALLVLGTLAAVTPPRPKVSGVGASFTLAPDSSVNVIATASLSGTLSVGDSLRFRFTRNDSVKVVKPPTVNLTQGASLVAPAYGQTATYRACVQVKRQANLVGSEVCSAYWTYSRPDTLASPPTINGVTITPASATLSPGQAITLTATPL